MPDAVIDTSAMIEVLQGSRPHPQLLQRVMLSQLAAPELLDVEAANVLRRLARCGRITDESAASTLADIVTGPVARAPHRALMARVWELRHSVSPYDAAYIALAEQLDAPLVTCDAKLANSDGHEAKIELYPTS